MVRVHHELAALLMKRNELASSVAGGASLPPMLRDAGPWGCTKCFSVNACAVAHKARRLHTLTCSENAPY